MLNSPPPIPDAIEPPPIPQEAKTIGEPITSTIDAIDWNKFILAGNATITLTSKVSGKHFTYKIRKKEEEGRSVIWFTSLLNGPDNWNNYQYFGQFMPNEVGQATYFHGRRSKISESAPSMLAWNYFLNNINKIPDELEVRHAGKCGRCARKLTNPASIDSGYGPECIKLINF